LKVRRGFRSVTTASIMAEENNVQGSPDERFEQACLVLIRGGLLYGEAVMHGAEHLEKAMIEHVKLASVHLWDTHQALHLAAAAAAAAADVGAAEVAQDLSDCDGDDSDVSPIAV